MPRQQYPKTLQLRMTNEMHANLVRIAGTERNLATVIREALRKYLDEQEDLAGSRRFFTKSFRDRIDEHETLQSWQIVFVAIAVLYIGRYILIALEQLTGVSVLPEGVEKTPSGMVKHIYDMTRRDGSELSRALRVLAEIMRDQAIDDH